MFLALLRRSWRARAAVRDRRRGALGRAPGSV